MILPVGQAFYYLFEDDTYKENSDTGCPLNGESICSRFSVVNCDCAAGVEGISDCVELDYWV
jgi:hypothetical protein